MKKTRLTYFDMAKGLAILIIVLGHIADGENPFIKWIYSFNVPLFFIISGCLLKLTEKKEKTFKQQIIMKFYTILIPYFIFAIPQIFTQYAISSFDIDVLVNNIKDTLGLVIYSVLWFLPALFLAELGFICFNTITSKVNRGIIFIASFAIPFAFSTTDMYGYKILFCRSSIGMGFLIIGYYVFEYINNNKLKWYMALPALAITYPLSQVNDVIDLFSMDLGNIPLYLFNSIIASISIIVLLKAIKVNIKPLEFCGKNSLLIMAIHELILEILGVILPGYRELGFALSLVEFAGVMAIVVIVVLIINSICSWPIGKKKKEFYNYVCKTSK